MFERARFSRSVRKKPFEKTPSPQLHTRIFMIFKSLPNKKTDRKIVGPQLKFSM